MNTAIAVWRRGATFYYRFSELWRTSPFTVAAELADILREAPRSPNDAWRGKVGALGLVGILVMAMTAAYLLAMVRDRRRPAFARTLWRLLGPRYAEELRAEWLDLQGSSRWTRAAFVVRIVAHHPAARLAEWRRTRRPV